MPTASPSRGEWILPFRGRNTSLGTEQNFLWRHGNVYLMDNHRAAAWCWRQHAWQHPRQGVLHIDAHFDTAGADPSRLAGLPRLGSIPFSEYIEHGFNHANAFVPLFRWDNYLSIYAHIYGAQVDRWVFSTHCMGQRPDFHYRDLPPTALLDFLRQQDQPALEWILNLDLDFFLSPEGERFPTHQRRPLLEAFREFAQRSAGSVVTIALSPECCGSWARAEALCSEVCEVFQLPFSLPAE